MLDQFELNRLKTLSLGILIEQCRQPDRPHHVRLFLIPLPSLGVENAWSNSKNGVWKKVFDGQGNIDNLKDFPISGLEGTESLSCFETGRRSQIDDSVFLQKGQQIGYEKLRDPVR